MKLLNASRGILSETPIASCEALQRIKIYIIIKFINNFTQISNLNLSRLIHKILIKRLDDYKVIVS